MQYAFIVWFFFLLQKIVSQKFEISFKSPTSPNFNEISLQRGKYAPISIIITRLTTDEFDNEKTTLTLSDASFISYKALKAKYNIDTSNTNIIETYIGVQCDAEVETETKKTINFISTNKNFIVKSLKVININNDKNILKVQLSESVIPFGGYSLLLLSNSIEEKKPFYNIETIDITFDIEEKINESEIEISPLSIERYEDKETTRYPHGHLIYSKQTSSSEDIKQITIVPKYNKLRCYHLDTDSLVLTLNSSVPFTDPTDHDISFSFDRLAPSTNILSFTSSVRPSMLYCVIIPSDYKYNDYSEDELYNPPHKYDDTKEQYFSLFFSAKQNENDTETETKEIVIQGLNRYYEYKYKCAFINNANQKYNKQKFKTTLIYTFEDYYVDFRKVDDFLPFDTHCAFFNFKSLSDQTKFHEQLQQKCYNDLVFNNNKQKYSNNGCLQCSTSLSESSPLSSSICIYSPTDCTSFTSISKQALDESFINFINNMNTTTKLKSIFNIDLELEEVNLESDLVPEQYNILVDINGQPSTKIDLLLANENEYSIKCFLGNDPNSFTDKIILQKKVFDIPLSVSLPPYTNSLYYIYYNCFPLSSLNNDELVFHSISFIPVAFIHADEKHRLNCEETPFVNKCIQKTVLSQPEAKTPMPEAYLGVKLEEFKTFTLYKQIIYIFRSAMNLKTISTGEQIEQFLKEIFGYFIYMQNIDCHSEINELCFEMERWVTKHVVDLLFDEIKIETKIFNDEETGFDKEVIVKLMLEVLFSTGNNGDAFDIESGEQILSFANKMMNDVNIVIQKLNETKQYDSETYNKIVDDILLLLTSSSSHLIDMFPFMESQKPKTNEDIGDFIQDNPLLKTYKSSITKMLFHFTQQYSKIAVNDYFNIINSRNNFDFIISPLYSRIKSFSFNYINITLPLEYIYKKYNTSASTLVTAITLFKKHPLSSTIHSSGNFSNYIVSFSIFDEYNNRTEDDFETPIELKYDISVNSSIQKKYKYSYLLTKEGTLDPTKVITDQSKDDIIVDLTQLGDVVVGSVDLGGKVVFRFEVWMIALCIVFGCLITTLGVYFICFVWTGAPAQRNLIEKQQEMNDAPLLMEDDGNEDDNENAEDDNNRFSKNLSSNDIQPIQEEDDSGHFELDVQGGLDN